MGRVKNLAEKKKKAHIYSGGGGGGTKGPEKVDKRNEEQKCPYCDRIFKQSGRLKDHILKKHAEEKEESENQEQPSTEKAPKQEVIQDVGSRGGYYTQKTPKMFLHEWCQKEKRPTPKYNAKQIEGEKWVCRVILNDPKKPEKSKFFYLDKALAEDSKEGACQSAALVALHDIARGRAMHRILPKPFIPLWDVLEHRATERQAHAERKENVEAARKVRKAKQIERESKIQEIYLSEENQQLIENLVRKGQMTDKAPKTPLKLQSEQKDIIERLQNLGFANEDATNAVRESGMREDLALEWLCLNVEESKLPKHFAPKALPVTVVSKVVQKEKSFSEEEKQLYKYGYSITKVRKALQMTDRNIDLAFRLLYSEHVLGMKGGSINVDSCRAQLQNTVPSSDWNEEKEILEAIYMEDFVEINDTKIQITCSADTEGQQGSQQCRVDFFYPLTGSYPQEAPWIGIAIEHVIEEHLFALTKKVTEEASALRGGAMIHDIMVSIPQYLEDVRNGQYAKVESGIGGESNSEAVGVHQHSPNGKSKARSTKEKGRRHMGERLMARGQGGDDLKDRQLEIQKQHPDKLQRRKGLPVASYSKQIINVLSKHGFCVVCGETGCGKSTQIPQFLLENEIESNRGSTCSIICTQPRRISALGLAERVAFERGEKVGDVIGYKVRLDSKVSKRTRVTYCTIGILLRTLIGDRNLSGVSHVVVDEVHERSLDSDMLLLLLKEVCGRRKDLKVMFMSATANAEAFSKYFKAKHHDQLVVNVPGKMFPVQQYFLEDAYSQLGWQMAQKETKKAKNEGAIDYRLIEHLVYMIMSDPGSSRDTKGSAILIFLPGMYEITKAKMQLRNSHKFDMIEQKLFIVPLHSTLTPSEQSKVYQRAPAGHTKVVLSTNIAETSITVDDVSFIIDAGRVKELQYDSERGLAMLKEMWISKASAKQRMGRAGRVRPGTCWHLFSESRFSHMAQFQSPEILRVPLDMLCLKVKACVDADLKESLQNMITPPEATAVQGAISKLIKVQAMDAQEELTPLGNILSEMPVDACVGKLLIYGVMMRCTDPIMTIAASMSSRPPFLSPQDEREEANAAHAAFASKSHKSDHLMVVYAFNSWQVVLQEEGYKKAQEFCRQNYLSFSALEGIGALRNDYAKVLLEFGFISKSYYDDALRGVHRKTHGEIHKQYDVDSEAYNSRIIKSVVCAAYYPAILRVEHPKSKYKEVEGGTVRKDNIPKAVKLYAKDLGKVFMHPSSSLFSVSLFETGWLAYSGVMQTSKIMVRECTMVPSFAVLLFGGEYSILHDSGMILIDNWARFKAPLKIAILVRELRNLVNKLLAKKVEYPQMDISTSKVADTLLKIMTTDGF